MKTPSALSGFYCTSKMNSIRLLWKFFVCVFLFYTSNIYATQEGDYYYQFLDFKTPHPWFTGPLLTPSGHVSPKGHIVIEPYIFAENFTGHYDAHWDSQSSKSTARSFISQNIFKVGILNRVDFRTVPRMFYNINAGASSVQFGDLPAGFDFQIIKAKAHQWHPNLKLSLIENFPTGKYQHGNPEKKGTDLVGRGSFETQLGLTASKLIHVIRNHYLSTRLSINYYARSSAHVNGFNFYGGGYGTHGKIYPGNELLLSSSLEYSLTQKWSLACDFVYKHENRDRFSGYLGTTTKSGSSQAIEGRPSSEQFSMAPAIEYSWSKNMGIVGGVWFTVAGRNSSEFLSGVIAFNYFR